MNINIIKCKFNNSDSSSNGGAIYFTIRNININFEACYFTDINSNSYGGSIYLLQYNE
jgi:hypothetical protein